jgi:hypothetical protein
MCFAAQIHKQLSQGFLAGRKIHKKVYGRARIVTKFRVFLEGSVAQFFLSGSQGLWTMNSGA